MTTIEDARAYVGTTPTSGVAQFAALALAGMRSNARVLEYGCGTLHLARVLAPFLLAGHYCAIEPNRWLVDAALADDPTLRTIMADREVQIATRDDFDASVFEQCGQFDYVFAHSVLSHASRDQLGDFLFYAHLALRDGGTLLASYRQGVDSDDDAWQYPGVSWFSVPTIQARADVHGFGIVIERPDIRRAYIAACPDEVHDWFEAHRLA